MNNTERLRVQAEQAFSRQSLHKLSEAVTDPALRTQVQALATGRMSAAEFVRYMERSATAMRGVDRFVKHVVTLSPEELDAIRAARERDVDRTVAELAATPPTPAVQQSGYVRRRPAEEDEDTWDEAQSWLE